MRKYAQCLCTNLIFLIWITIVKLFDVITIWNWPMNGHIAHFWCSSFHMFSVVILYVSRLAHCTWCVVHITMRSNAGQRSFFFIMIILIEISYMFSNANRIVLNVYRHTIGHTHTQIHTLDSVLGTRKKENNVQLCVISNAIIFCVVFRCTSLKCNLVNWS